MNRISIIFLVLFSAFVVHFIFVSLVTGGGRLNTRLQNELVAAKSLQETLEKENNVLTARERVEEIAEDRLGMVKSEFLKDNLDFVLWEETRKGWTVEFLGTITTSVLAADRQ